MTALQFVKLAMRAIASVRDQAGRARVGEYQRVIENLHY